MTASLDGTIAVCGGAGKGGGRADGILQRLQVGGCERSVALRAPLQRLVVAWQLLKYVRGRHLAMSREALDRRDDPMNLLKHRSKPRGTLRYRMLARCIAESVPLQQLSRRNNKSPRTISLR